MMQWSARPFLPLAPKPESVESDPSWSHEQAEAAFFQRLTLEEEVGADRGGAEGDPDSKAIGKVPSQPARQLGAMSGRYMRPAFCSLSRLAFPPIRWECTGA